MKAQPWAWSTSMQVPLNAWLLSSRRRGSQASRFRLDVSKRDQVVAAFDTFVEKTGRLDVLFNNAGFNVPMHLLDVTDENWHSIMDVNAFGVLVGIQEGARRMIPTGGGKIVNTSSIAGRQGYPSFAPYCASKFAVNALTQAAARGLAEHNITCNAFAPGVVATPLWAKLDEDLMSIGDSQKPGQAHRGLRCGHPARSCSRSGGDRGHGLVPGLVRFGLPHGAGHHDRWWNGAGLVEGQRAVHLACNTKPVR